MKLIAVEANIGAGKSTLLPKLVKELGQDWKAIQEPVDDPEFMRLLEQFTQNPHDTTKRLEFQKYITERRAKLLADIPDGNYVIERSLFSDLIFSQVNMLGMERPSGEYLSYYYDIIDRLKDYPQVDAVVYLQTNPRVSWERMRDRARGAEDGTPLSYLTDLSRYHDAALPQICREYGATLCRFDWDNYGGDNGPENIASFLRSLSIV